MVDRRCGHGARGVQVADDRHDIGIRDELLGRGDRLGGVALIIQRREHKPLARKDGPLRRGVLDRQLRAVEEVLSVRGLITGERRDEADLYDRLGPTTSGKEQEAQRGDT